MKQASPDHSALTTHVSQTKAVHFLTNFFSLYSHLPGQEQYPHLCVSGHFDSTCPCHLSSSSDRRASASPSSSCYGMMDNESRGNGSREMWWEDEGRRASVVSVKHLDFSHLYLVNSNALSGIQRAGYCMRRYGHNVLSPSGLIQGEAREGGHRRGLGCK